VDAVRPSRVEDAGSFRHFIASGSPSAASYRERTLL
jgi:hypothetical protein